MNYRKMALIVLATFLSISILVVYFVMHRTHNVATKQNFYIALGDSVAAGQGLNTDSDSSACYRTEESYPHYVASILKYNLINISCSGATINNGLIGEQTVNDLILTSQVDQLTSYTKAKLVTITIGANDVGWTQIISKCYVSECGTPEDVVQLNSKRELLTHDINTLMQRIKKITNGSTIVLSGYYDIYPALKSKCVTTSGLSDAELSWLDAQTKSLNQTIQKSIAPFSFVRFAPVDFNGHELCTSDPWVQDINSKAPFHPTADGQKAIGESIVSVIVRQ